MADIEQRIIAPRVVFHNAVRFTEDPTRNLVNPLYMLTCITPKLDLLKLSLDKDLSYVLRIDDNKGHLFWRREMDLPRGEELLKLKGPQIEFSGDVTYLRMAHVQGEKTLAHYVFKVKESDEIYIPWEMVRLISMGPNSPRKFQLQMNH